MRSFRELALRMTLLFGLIFPIQFVAPAPSAHAAQMSDQAAVSCSAPTTYTATSHNAADLTEDVDKFRNAIGDLNQNEPINHAGGRRQVNWDAAPDPVSAPNAFPGDFFNFNAAPRARGIEFATDGKELQLSANDGLGIGIEFDNIDPDYSSEFTFFSKERLFAPIGSNVVDVTFFSPLDQKTKALVDAFGVIFTDVDLAETTKMHFYDVDDKLVYTLDAPWKYGSETLSLAGATFDAPCIARVRIITGNIALNPGCQRSQQPWLRPGCHR